MPNSNFFLGKPLLFRDRMYIYPPTVNDSLDSDFQKCCAVLTLSFEEIEDVFETQIRENPDFKTPQPFEFLIINSYSDKEYEEVVKKAFKLFLKEDITFLYDQKAILVGSLEKEILNAKKVEDLMFIKDEKDYFILQNLIREAIGEKAIEPPDPNMHPKKKRMLALARMRDRAKAKQNAKKGLTFDNTIVAICCMGLGLNPLNIGELSYCALNSLIACYQGKEQYELDIQSLLAGADSKKVHPKYWIRNLNE